MKQFIFGLAMIGLFATSCKNEKAKGGEEKEVTATEQTENLTSYSLDSANSVINWRGYKIAEGAEGGHYGTIHFNSTGEFTAEGEQLKGGSFEVNMNSVVVTDIGEEEGKSKLEAHLKDGDFFETEKFPSAKFEITKVTPSTEKADFNTQIEGNFTIKDVTKSYTFLANTATTDSTFVIKTEEFDINRQEFNVVYQSTMKDVVIKDNIQLQIVVTGDKK